MGDVYGAVARENCSKQTAKQHCLLRQTPPSESTLEMKLRGFGLRGADPLHGLIGLYLFKTL